MMLWRLQNSMVFVRGMGIGCLGAAAVEQFHVAGERWS